MTTSDEKKVFKPRPSTGWVWVGGIGLILLGIGLNLLVTSGLSGPFLMTILLTVPIGAGFLFIGVNNPVHLTSPKTPPAAGEFFCAKLYHGISHKDVVKEFSTMAINTLVNYGSFAILGILWLGFGAAMLFNQTILDSLWQSFLAFPLIAQLSLGLLFLPLVAGLWIWQTPWPLWLRLVLVVGLGIATVYTFFPKQA